MRARIRRLDKAARLKLFQIGRNQGVRIPRELELPGEDPIMRKDGSRLALLRTLSPLEDEFVAIKELPVDGVDL